MDIDKLIIIYVICRNGGKWAKKFKKLFPFMLGIIMFSILLCFFHGLYNALTTIFITNISSLIIELYLQ